MKKTRKITRYLQHPSAIIVYLMNKNFFNWMSDKLYIKIKYYLVIGKWMDLNNPETFNEKIQWLKLYDRKDIYTALVDKYIVKRKVADAIGNEYVIPTIGVYDKVEDIDFNELPDRFVMKCTHDSGGIVICKNRKDFDELAAKKKINKYLRRKYYYVHREWPYKNVKPRIIIEKYMEDDATDELTDYKVMCFGGKAKMVFTCTERFGDGLKVTFFDLDWNKLPFERHYPASKKNIPRPKNLDKMIELSEKLAKGIPFVRIDWYEINGKLYFGEYTFYPGSGLEEFTPEEWDKKLGDLLDLGLVEK